MQIASMPPPIATSAMPQDVVNKAVAPVQAAAPLIHNAVAPTPKTEKSNAVHPDKDQRRRGQGHEGQKDKKDEGGDDDKGGHTVNISV